MFTSLRFSFDFLLGTHTKYKGALFSVLKKIYIFNSKLSELEDGKFSVFADVQNYQFSAIHTD